MTGKKRRLQYMNMATVEVSAAEILVGWKAIAERLGVCVATAQRYEREDELPVYRIRGSVRIDSGDLGEWLRNFKQF